MDLLDVELQNFLTIKSAKVQLNNRGLVLIQGVNEEDTSASSNGAGKSTLGDGIDWVIYGETARGESGDAIINDKVGKDCFGAVNLKDGDDFYEIRRHRKHKTEKNATHVLMSKGCRPSEAMPADIVALHKGTEKETQEVINKVIGCSHDVFTAAVYAGQEQMPDLPSMTDKQLKLLIEEAAGIEVLAKAHEIAKAEATTAETEARNAGFEVSKVQSAIDTLTTQIKDVEEMISTFEAGRPKRVDAAKDALKPLAARIRDLKAKADAIDVAAIDAELATIKEAFDKRESFVNSANEANDKYQAELRFLSGLQVAESTANKDKANAARALATIETKVGKPCGECGKPYGEHDIEDAKKIAERVLAERNEVANQAQAKIAAQEAKVATVKAQYELAKSLVPDLSALSRRQVELNANLAERRSTMTVLSNTVTLFKTEKARVEQLETEENPHVGQLAKLKAQLTAKTAEKEAATKVFEEANKTLQMRKDVVAVFSPAGVRAHILDTVTPFLNEQTKEYLGALSDGAIHAVWSTTSLTAKGELRERFAIDVTNTKGGKTFKLLSGGEKRKVRIACALALQDLVSSRATKPINLFIADEVDDALDEAGLERLMGILERKARERGTVLVISHNSLRDWIDQVIVVTKKGDGSTVSGAIGEPSVATSW